MNRKQLFILAGLGLLLGGLGLHLTSSRRAAYDTGRDIREGQKLLGDFPVNDVARVTVRTRDSEVTVVKTNGAWVVTDRSGYPAAFSPVAELLRKLWDLRAVQSQQIGQSQWGRLDLLTPAREGPTNAATLIELRDKDGKPVRSLLLGKKQMRDSGGQFGGFPVGRWIALPDDQKTVFVVSESFAEVEPKPENWLNKDFFKAEKLTGISFISTHATNSWSLSRTNETADWVLDDAKPGENLDKSKVSGLNWAFSSPTFNDVLTRDDPAVKDAFATPILVKLKTAEGFGYNVQIGSQPDNDSFLVAVAAVAELPGQRTAPAEEKPEDKEAADKAWQEAQDKLKARLKQEQTLGGWVFKVPKWTVDSVLKDRAALLADQAAGAPPANAASPGAAEAPAEVIPPLRAPGDPPGN